MKEDMQRCMRCKGRKKIYKVAGAYSYVDTGGVEITCPLCLGAGEIKTLKAASRAIENEKRKSSVETTEDVTHGRKKEKRKKEKGKADEIHKGTR